MSGSLIPQTNDPKQCSNPVEFNPVEFNPVEFNPVEFNLVEFKQS